MRSFDVAPDEFADASELCISQWMSEAEEYPELSFATIYLPARPNNMDLIHSGVTDSPASWTISACVRILQL